MRYIEKDGTRHSWAEGRPIPEGWTEHKGQVPGPPEPTKRETDIHRLVPEFIAIIYDNIDDPKALEKAVAKVKEVKDG